MTIEEALDFEGLGIYDEKIKTHIQNEIEKETLRATTVENNKVNNTDVAKSNALGLVKSGTDITVDLEGNVSINDNSHNHLLENISDLLTTKDELNVLNGIDVQTTELNKLKGVADNVQTQLNKKAPLDSPDLTGIPTAPTAESGNKTTQIATTEFVQNEINNLGEKASAKRIYIEEANQETYGTSYAISFHQESNKKQIYGGYSYLQEDIVNGEKPILADDGLYYYIRMIYNTVLTSVEDFPYAELRIGNNKWSNIDTRTYEEGSKFGAIRLYGVGNGNIGQTNSKMESYSVRILPNVLTGNRTIYLPDISGTLALTTSNVASADKAIKAEQDINGNAIEDTYAVIENPTFKNSLLVTGGGDSMEVKVVGSNTSLSYKMGKYCSATGQSSCAQGHNSRAAGFVSHSDGMNSIASGDYSYAGGRDTEASGAYSFSIGYGTYALDYQLAIGHYNKKSTTGDAFIIGNGWNTGGSPCANAFRIEFDGTTYSNGEYISSGADYAEFFEWSDGNTDNEDRRGYFVTLEDDKIRIANHEDYIIGIISGQPSVIGNGDEDWRGRYILDEFGSYIYEDIEVTEDIYNKETGELEKVTKIIKAPKQNPEYDSSKPYIQRKDRPEWDCVGMMGVLSVRDDGTCQVNGYCNVTDGGIATSSDSGYRVIKRVNDNIVKIVFKG